MLKILEKLIPKFSRSTEPVMGSPGHRGYRMDKTRICPCCDKSHQCRETFEEMVDRCIDEKDGSLIFE